MKVIFEDRVSSEYETVFFPNAEKAYFNLAIRLSGAAKVVSVDWDSDGSMHFIFHDYIVRGQINEVFIKKD